MQNFVEIYQLVLEIQRADGWTNKTPLAVTCLFFLTILLSAPSEVIVFFRKVVYALN